jgi:molybdopterin-guanine dinucleotide biosynthesis protein A
MAAMAQTFTPPFGAILSGGEGRRLGRGLKALTPLRGRPLIAHVAARLRPQTAGLAVSVRAPDAWPGYGGLPAVTDTQSAAGPLAGVAAVLDWVRRTHPDADAVLTCPADTPFVPPDLAARLRAALTEGADIAVAASGGRRHHLVALWRTALADELSDCLRREGAVAVQRYQQRRPVREVAWDTQPVDPFFNVNTPADLTAAENFLCSDAFSTEPSP